MPDFKVLVNEQGQAKVPQGGGVMKMGQLNDPCNPLGSLCGTEYGPCELSPLFDPNKDEIDGFPCWQEYYTLTCQQYDIDGPEGPLPLSNVCDYIRDQAGSPAVQGYVNCGQYYKSTSSCSPPSITFMNVIP